LLPEEEEKND